jgi:hypothetical protein
MEAMEYAGKGYFLIFNKYMEDEENSRRLEIGYERKYSKESKALPKFLTAVKTKQIYLENME